MNNINGTEKEVTVYRKKFTKGIYRKSVLIYKTRICVKLILHNNPAIYLRLMHKRHAKYYTKNRLVNLKSDLVIEGFPRSGNSFAVRAFDCSQNCDVNIAHHFHSWPQVAYAVKHNIPTIVLIRKPVDAVIGLCVHSELEHAVPKKLSKEQHLVSNFKQYINFYKNIPKHQNSLLVATFEEVTQNFSDVILRFNQKFSKSYNTFNHTDDMVETIFNKSGRHLSPSKERDALKPKYLEIINNTALKKTLALSDQLYLEIVKSRIG